MRHLAAAITLGLSSLPLQITAQDIASQIDRVRDGAIRLSVETRPEICGNGRSIGEETERGFVLYTAWDQGFSISQYDYWAPDCNRGPLRLVVEKSAGQVTDLRLAVGVDWRSDASGTDLGMVPGPDAAAFLLGAAQSNREDVSRIAFLAANAVRDARIADRLLAIARDRSLHDHVRQGAMRWLNGAASREGRADDADRVLRDLAAASDEDSGIRDRAVRQIRSTPANDSYLRDLYRRASTTLELRERILRRLGDSENVQNLAWVRGIALDSNEPTELRERALRVIAQDLQGGDLREIFPELDQPELKERVIRLVAERSNDADRQWLMTVALDAGEPVSVRERAIRVLAGEGSARLRDLYGRLDRVELRERVLRTAAEGYDDETTAWLRSIVLNSSEHETLRDRALRVLGDRDRAEARRLFEQVDQHALRERALRIAGETRDAETLSWLESVATNNAYPIDLRDRALRILGDHDRTAARRLFERLDAGELRDRALRIVGSTPDGETATWLERIATEATQSLDLRDRALRLLAEQPIPSARLAALYDRMDRQDLRQRVIRLLADRSDDDAVQKLIDIAENDPDRDLRRYALRRLGDTRNPR